MTEGTKLTTKDLNLQTTLPGEVVEFNMDEYKFLFDEKSWIKILHLGIYLLLGTK